MSYQSSETPTRASIDAHREWCRFVFENSDLNDMDEETLSRVWWRDDAADLANTRAFSYGGIKEATAIFFWSKQRGVYRLDEPVLQSRRDSCNLDEILAISMTSSPLTAIHRTFSIMEDSMTGSNLEVSLWDTPQARSVVSSTARATCVRWENS
jgi:hypothetical protein